MSRTVSLVFIHVLGCLAFLALPYLLAENGFAKLAQLTYNSHERRNLLSYLLTIAFFYANYYGLIPRLYFRRKYVWYVLWVLGCFLVVQQTLVWVNRQTSPPPGGPTRLARPPKFGSPFRPGERPPLPPGGLPPGRSLGDSLPPGGPDQPGLPSEFTQTFFLFLVSLLMSLAIRINNRWREAERQRLNTELSYLKAQINPHFLFNTLNSIYSLAIERSDRTAEAITRLSSLMRYVMQEPTHKQVPLAHELAYISHYVALQKLRLDDTARIDFVITGQASGHQIAPLILISFIENAFKYGVNPSEDSPIRIALSMEGNELHSHVFNKKVQLAPETITTSGIGLPNANARLQLLYPGKHQLVINNQPDSFTVDLSITLS